MSENQEKQQNATPAVSVTVPMFNEIMTFLLEQPYVKVRDLIEKIKVDAKHIQFTSPVVPTMKPATQEDGSDATTA